ncbi:MAG: response regulator receiver modulated CheB methylesterase [Armatimonadetes bacterium]|jgi:two-component system chemotaxis response regulator CheB|nr:response regulator receiver modulated CheB methylesterase [Armatimonadota bacterium]
MNRAPIRVLLVDHSPAALTTLKRMLAASPGISVVGTASTGQAALQMIPRLQPDVICTDLVMPGMDGLQLTREVMARFPRPILVVSSAGRAKVGDPVLEAGALDILPKPAGETAADYERLTRDLAAKIRIVAGVHVFRRANGATRVGAEAPTPAAPAPRGRRAADARLVVIGASTGGPLVLRAIVEQLPENYALPVICVQHISNGFLAGLVDWLGGQARVRVKIAESGEQPTGGTVYFPAENSHLELDAHGNLLNTHKPPMDGHRPSITTTMLSVASYYGNSAVGVLLTGMGTDGAAGLLAIAEGGGMTIAQDEASCVVFGMPKDAIARGAAQHVLPPAEIARLLSELRAAPTR